MAQETQTGFLYQPRGVGWGGRWEGGPNARGYMYTYGLFMLRFDRKQQNSVRQFSSLQSLSRVWLFVTPQTAAFQASLSIINSQSLLKLKSIMSVRPSNHLILCRPLLLPPSIIPSIRVFSNELVLCIRWPKYYSFSFSTSPSNEYSRLISFRMDWLDLLKAIILK